MMTIDIYLKSLAWKVLRREFWHDGQKVDITKTWLYPYVISMAEHSRGRVMPRDGIGEGYISGQLIITDYDYEHTGGHLTEERMKTLSKMICDKERDDVCLRACYLHALTGVGMAPAIESILIKRGYDDDELNYQQLKKCYQRHFRQVEKDIVADYHRIEQLKKIQ